MPAMLGCSTVCPKCQHEFTCCPPAPCCSSSAQRRSLHVLSGGGITTTTTALATPACFSPQISPSAPLSFIIPYAIQPVFAPLECRLQPPPPDADLHRLADTARVLHLSGWYYEGITYQKSQELLKGCKVGTFLVRDSSNSQFLYSLSVQTERGPTSVRLFYSDGYFRLDAQRQLQSAMPLFPSVVELVQHYVTQSRRGQNDALVWIDPAGKCYSSIVLDEPLRKEGETSSLKHLARLAVHRALQAPMKSRISSTSSRHGQLELPASLKAYLGEYPYSV